MSPSIGGRPASARGPGTGPGTGPGRALAPPSTVDFNQALWSALVGMKITAPGVRVSFIDRLMAETKWSRSAAEAAYGEYLRFLYLAGTVKHVVTPSKTVDEVWHLHLTWSKHYWDVLCGQILRRRFEHVPSGESLRASYRTAQQYLQTLESYEAAFGQPPPETLWPPPSYGRKRPVAAAVAFVFWSSIVGGLWGFGYAKLPVALTLMLVVVAFTLSTLFAVQSQAGNGSCGGGGCSSSSCGGGGD